MIRYARIICVLLAVLFVSGCVSEPDPTTEIREDAITAFYMPRTTEITYVYQYSGLFSGKRDSLFNVDYRGVPRREDRSIDGHSPIHKYSVTSADGKQGVDIDLFVSDNVIVEYGTDCTTKDERFVPLMGTLKAGHQWQAAQGFRASNSYQISFLARVVQHYAELEVGGVRYPDVWQVNYEVTGFNTVPAGTPSEFHPKARRVIYFARGVGKILEIAYSPDNNPQWQNAIVEIRPR